jgi:hypothetical protein
MRIRLIILLIVATFFNAPLFAELGETGLSPTDGQTVDLPGSEIGPMEDTPFFLLSTFGGSSDLRGYPSGRYRDRMMYAIYPHQAVVLYWQSLFELQVA